MNFTAAVLNRAVVPLTGKIISIQGSHKNRYRSRRRIFGRRRVVRAGEGYYRLDPMPSEDHLRHFYSEMYWYSRAPKAACQTRDFVHFDLITRTVKTAILPGKVFLNFGAGHGGISYLMRQAGMDVINVDPHAPQVQFETRWLNVTSLSAVPDKSVDFLYGSHSLEHVPDIEHSKSEIERVLKTNGLMFLEVPNAGAPGGKKLRIPHTYYFERSFFLGWIDEIVLCESFTGEEVVIEPAQEASEAPGSVIRVLGRLR